MTRLAPISARELQTIFSRLGFRLVRRGEDIGRGLLRQIVRDVSIDLEEFARLRKK